MTWYARPQARAWTCDPAPDGVLEFHRTLPGYAPTPLVELPLLAAELRVGRVFVKDESARLGLPAFKVLGAAYAIHRAVAEDTADLLITATDGNHGRAVAWMARQLGRRARVYLPEVARPAADAIAAEGAEARVVAMGYDDAVRLAAEDADGLLIQDTAWPGYERIPGWIVDGYSTMLREIDVRPDLVVVPMGVGSLAQAVLTNYRSDGSRAAVLGVEPDTAACVQASLRAGRIIAVSTSDTVMAGLNCGVPSSLAWPVLRAGLDAAITITDRQSLAAVENLAAFGLSCGPCGAATLVAARLALGEPEHRAALGLRGDSTVVLLSTEASRAQPQL